VCSRLAGKAVPAGSGLHSYVYQRLDGHGVRMIERTHKDKIRQYTKRKLRRLFKHHAKRHLVKWQDGPFRFYRFDDQEFRFRIT
jgi:hypothetical protein